MPKIKRLAPFDERLWKKSLGWLDYLIIFSPHTVLPTKGKNDLFKVFLQEYERDNENNAADRSFAFSLHLNLDELTKYVWGTNKKTAHPSTDWYPYKDPKPAYVSKKTLAAIRKRKEPIFTTCLEENFVKAFLKYAP